MHQARVRELFEDDEGSIRWKGDGKKTITVNKDGYRLVWVDSKLWLLHRLVWLYHNGYLPENGIDHIDRNKSNNNISNLREVSKSCNARNTGNPKSNRSGVKGISWHKSRSKWKSTIKVNYKSLYLGRYEDFDEAVLVRLAAEQCLNWEGCDSNSPAFQYYKENIKNGS